MIELLYEKMGIPKSCFLGKRVFKKHFYENAKLTFHDKKLFRDHIEVMHWQYTLKPSTIQIEPYIDSHREYIEIAVLKIKLLAKNRYKRISEIIHKAIPYPLLLVFSHEDSLALSIAHKRFSHANMNSIIAENIINTNWWSLDNASNWHRDFMESLNVATFNHSHFYAFYQDFEARIISFNCARYTKQFFLPDDITNDERLQLIRDVEAIDQQLSQLRIRIKTENNLGKKIQNNLDIKEIILTKTKITKRLMGV